MEKSTPSTEQIETISTPSDAEIQVVGANFEQDESSLPPGYFTSKFFIGSMAAIGLGLMAGVAAFGYAAPILGIINADIGPSPNTPWIPLTYTLTTSITLTTIGRLSDIFGRRPIFTTGALLGVIGSIISATASSIPMLIIGTTVMGIAASTQLSYFYVMGELVPMKYRLAGNAFCYLFCIPGSGIAPVLAWTFVEKYPAVGWRGCYYVLIGVQTASFACWFFFYHPPTFRMKHGADARVARYLRDFDYAGTLLYTGGLLVFLMGLNWGGAVYPWSSAYVIGCIVAGFFGLLAFVLYECYARLKEPLVPMGLFRNYSWNASVVLTGLGASVYYAFAIVWPAMVAVLYSDRGVMSGAWLSSLVGLCITIGQIVGGFSGKAIGYLKWQCVVGITLGAVCFGAMATCGVGDGTRASTLLAFGVFFIGWVEGAAITIVTLTAPSQTSLGTSSGLAGSLRFLISTLAATIYNVILSNRLATTIRTLVPPALLSASLPSTSISAFIAALPSSFSLGAAGFARVPGATEDIVAAGVMAYKQANAEAYRTVFLSTIAFSGVAVVCSLLLPDVDHLLTGRVAATLGKEERE